MPRHSTIPQVLNWASKQACKEKRAGASLDGGRFLGGISIFSRGVAFSTETLSFSALFDMDPSPCEANMPLASETVSASDQASSSMGGGLGENTSRRVNPSENMMKMWQAGGPPKRAREPSRCGFPREFGPVQPGIDSTSASSACFVQ